MTRPRFLGEPERSTPTDNRFPYCRLSESKHNRWVSGTEHDRITADNLLRTWEGGSDDWVCRRIEQLIERCEGLSPEAKASLQERLKILQTGDPLEVLSVIAGLSKHCPEWSSARADEVVRAALKRAPAIAKAVAECGILRAGRKDWKAFAWWLERKFPREYGRSHLPAEDANRPKIIAAKFSLRAPEENRSEQELGTESPPA